MPITTTSCALCGGPIEDIFHSSHVDSTTWERGFRVVYTILNQWEAARLSGIGERRQFEDVFPLDDSVDMNLPGIPEGATEIEIELMSTRFGRKFPPDPPLTPHPAWGFPFHNCCWEIISVASIRFQGNVNVQAIFDLCRSQPYRLGRLDWGHDYEGIVAYIDDVASLCPGEEPELHPKRFTTDIYMYNPLDIPELRRLFTTEFQYVDTEQAKTTSRMKQGYPYNPDPFAILPTEILQMILIWMDSRDVANLRLASPVYALTALPDIFWCSRFWQGREFGHVFEANSSHPAGGSWRWLFEQTKTLAGNPSMSNRKRIWSLACRLCELMNVRLNVDGCYGIPIRTLFEPEGMADNDNWLTAGPVLSDPTSSFSQGARSLYERRVTVRNIPTAIFVSVVEINKKQYISGIRINLDDGQNISLGYCVPDKEFKITPGSSLHPTYPIGFHIAFDHKGVRGLRILWPEEIHSSWIGNWSNISQKALVMPRPVLSLKLKGGFDALKLVSLSVSDEQGTVPSRRDRFNHQSGLRENAVWHAEIPPKELAYLGPINPVIQSRGDELPFSLALFGSSDGSQLPYLTEVIVWVVDHTPAGVYADRTHIWAIEFSFNHPINGRYSVPLGKVPDFPECEVHRVHLKSDEGERITSLEALYEDRNFIFGFRIHTNRERSVELPPSCTALLHEDGYFIDTLNPEGTIVGLYAVLKHKLVFQSLGVAYIPATLPSSPGDHEKEKGV